MLIDPKKTLFITSRGPIGAAVKEAPVDGKSYLRKDGGWSEAIVSEGGSGFSGSYNDLSNKPVLFDGAYNSLSGKPIIPTKVEDLDVTIAGRSDGKMLVWDALGNTHKYVDVPSGGGSAMSLSTSKATIVASTVNTAASSTDGLIDVKAKYGGIITVKIVNGATAPTLPCRVYIFISHEDTLPAAGDASWKSIWGFSGTTVANESITQAFTFGPEIRHIKVLFDGNTDQNVTVEALASLYEIS